MSATPYRVDKFYGQYIGYKRTTLTGSRNFANALVRSIRSFTSQRRLKNKLKSCNSYQSDPFRVEKLCECFGYSRVTSIRSEKIEERTESCNSCQSDPVRRRKFVARILIFSGDPVRRRTKNERKCTPAYRDLLRVLVCG